MLVATQTGVNFALCCKYRLSISIANWQMCIALE